MAGTRIQICGRVVVELEGRRVEHELPGRQGKLLFVYLAANRWRPAPRSELVEALWPGGAPHGAESSLSALLSRLRRVLGPGALAGKSELRLALPADAWIDLEAAGEGLHRAEAAVARGDWVHTWAPARIALAVANRGFLPGLDAPWIDERRRHLDDVRLRALECIAASGLGLGGAELATAEQAARELVEREPYRESGYRFLMEICAARGNVAEALQVYEGLRLLLREELGVPPSAAVQALHRDLLGRRLDRALG